MNVDSFPQTRADNRSYVKLTWEFLTYYIILIQNRTVVAETVMNFNTRNLLLEGKIVPEKQNDFFSFHKRFCYTANYILSFN